MSSLAHNVMKHIKGTIHHLRGAITKVKQKAGMRTFDDPGKQWVINLNKLWGLEHSFTE